MPKENVKLVLDLIDGSNNESSGLMYELVGCWPSMIGDVEFSQAAGEIATFAVTVVYQYYTKRKDAAAALSPEATGPDIPPTVALTPEQQANFDAEILAEDEENRPFLEFSKTQEGGQ